MRRLFRPHPATDLRLAYRNPDPEVERLQRLREGRPSLLQIARAGRQGPEGLIELLERYQPAR